LGTIYYGSGFISNGFMVLNIDYYNNDGSVFLLTSSDDVSNNSVVWHARLGHIGQERMARLAREGLIGNLAKVTLPTCEHCLIGKSKRKPFGKATRASFPLQLIHSDICGPMNVRPRHGGSYFITFIDDFTRNSHVYLISHKSEALDCFRRYVSLVKNQLDKSIKALRTDRGREYLSKQFKELCDKKGIMRQLMMPRTPQQNGVAKRRNRTLLEMVRSIMAQANLPISYWGDAILTAAYILNRVPSKSVPSTPYELWIGKKPNLSNLRPWGSAGFVHDTFHKYGKLGPRGKKCIFIKYSEHSKGYVLIGEQPDGSVTEMESRDVDFIENEFPSRGEVDKDLTLYEMMDPNEGAPSSLVENQEEILETPRDSGSDLQPSGSAPLEEDSQQP
jgi:transposase InsO family protein